MVSLKDTVQNEDPPLADQPKNIAPPLWPQPDGLFREVKSAITFNPNVFLSVLRDVHEIVELRNSTDLTMQQAAFAALFARRAIKTEDGSVLFKLFDVKCVPEPPQELVVWQANNKFIRLDILRAPVPNVNSQPQVVADAK